MVASQEYNHAFWYTKSCLKSSIKFQERCIKSCQKSHVKSDTIYNRDNANNTQRNLENREENVPSCTVNKHMVNMSPCSSNNEGNEMSNKQRETMSKNDLKNRSVSSDQCMSGTSVFNNCIREYSKFNSNKIKGLSKKFVQRSRHALFYASIQGHAVDCIASSCHLRHRDREPSRIQVKWLTRKFRKSRAFRKYLGHKIKRSVPRSSHLQNILSHIINCRDSRIRSIRDVNCPNIFAKCWTNPAARNLKFYVPDGILADIFYLSDGIYFTHKQVYKNVNHITNVCESALCTDIETNPGPLFYVDPSETIRAPYSQGNQYIFGETAGQQCLAMCLCALIYNKQQNICSPQDLVNIMNIGNELYLHLSRLARQSFLMFSELPSELTVFDKDFHFEYSESYSGNVIGNSFIEGYQYCVPFHRSFEILLRENYHAFVLTINNNAVCIFCTNDDKYKIFDSHARDIYGRSHLQGTCVLLETATIDHVVLHFQSLYSDNSQFELKGVNIYEVPVQLTSLQNLNNNVRNDELLDNTLQKSECAGVLCLCRQCCAVSLHSICYSVIKPCNYWDSNTVAAVVYFGTTLYNNTKISVPIDIPQKIQIHGTEIVVKLQANIKGVITDKAESKLNIESIIPQTNENTGFLIWFGNYCISCIFQATSINSMSYSILAYDDNDDDTSCNAHYIKNIKDKSTLIS